MIHRLFGQRENLAPNYIILGLLCAFAVIPILILGFNSLKSNLELGENSIGFPRQFQWSNYPDAWEQGGFAVTMTNSVIFVVGTVTGVVVLGGMAAYALARLNPRGSNLYMIYMLSLSTIPFWLYAVPLFILWKNLSLLNTRFGLIVIYIALNSPFAIFLLRSFLVKFPPDFEDAARVDGATEIQVLTKVVLPIMWPGLLTVALVVALGVWGEFQIALIFMQEDEKMPLTTSYFNFMRRFSRDWSLTAAGAIMMILPVLIIFMGLQRRFVEGLTQGGLK